MTAFSTEITLNGNMLIHALEQARGHIGGQDLMTSIGLSLKKRNEDRHKAETDPDGNPWVPLKPYTLKHKTNPRMLVETGDMLLKHVYIHASQNRVTIGTADWKAYWHHAGTRRKSDKGPTRGLPPRPLFGLPPGDQTFVIELIQDHLDAVLHRAHLR